MTNKKPNPIRDKSFAFALQVVTIAQRLHDEKRAYVLANQLLRSGTAIGALVREAEFAQSKPDFISKMSIALKEANETDYWIDLLNQSHLMTDNEYNTTSPAIQELIRLLVAIVKSAKS